MEPTETIIQAPDAAMSYLPPPVESPLLPLLLLLPLLFAFGLALQPRIRDEAVRRFSLLYSVILLIISGIIASKFDWTISAQTQLQMSIRWVQDMGLNFSFGADALSLSLVLLTTFLVPLVILGSWTSVQSRVREFHVWLFFLQAALIGAFVAQDAIFFYLCFEFTLLPMFFLIGIFGSTHRTRAARTFFIYTFTASVFMLAGLIYLAWFATTITPSTTGGWSFDINDLTLAAQQMTPSQQTWLMLALLGGLAVKVPLFPLHSWQPLAYSEAPTGGSVLLSGVLLKMGTYGLLRFVLPMTPMAVAEHAPIIAVLAIAGILYAALICWVQKDLKRLIAYSSMSHMGFCVLGIFAINAIGAGGAAIYMINHGLSVAALFLCLGMVIERFNTRDIRDLSGLGRIMPVWATFMVFFVLASVGLPGLNGFVGEFLTLLGTFQSKGLGPVYATVAGLGIIFSAIYLLYMVGQVIFGPVRVPAVAPQWVGAGERGGVLDLTLREIVVLTPLAIGCLALGLYPKPVLDSFDGPARMAVAPAMVAQIQDQRDFSRNNEPEHATVLPQVVVDHAPPQAAAVTDAGRKSNKKTDTHRATVVSEQP